MSAGVSLPPSAVVSGRVPEKISEFLTNPDSCSLSPGHKVLLENAVLEKGQAKCERAHSGLAAMEIWTGGRARRHGDMKTASHS